MATETQVQELVHKLEEGRWAKWVKLAVLLGAIVFMINLWFFRDSGFKGLTHEKAIEQAQIAREIARGNGFTTKVIRPAALWLFEKNKGAFPVDRQPDIYHAPLNPWINSWFLRLVKKDWPMTKKDLQYTPDRVIAGVGVLFFLLSVLVNYHTAKRLFDRRLALLAVGLLLLCQQFWNFALSGLPQMLMLFLFSGAVHTLIRAVEARYLNQSPMRWIAATGALFGLLALAHGITIWIFAGALLFVTLLFRPWGRAAGLMLAVFLVCYSPWLIRNARVSGTPVGLGWYSGLHQIKGSESQIMRSMEVSLAGVSPRVFRKKVQVQTLGQFDNLYRLLGSVVVAPIFFVALMHLFKRPETAVFRWCILLMWLAAVLGMSVFGFGEGSGLAANDLHVLFIPLMSFYGLAFLLVMWSRLEMNIRLVRLGFLTLVFIISALPFIDQFLVLVGPAGSPVAWPPYVPPYIAILNEWTEEKEIIASDMPWAVAWYADRKSLWLPMSVKDFLDLNDFNQLNGRIVGLHLTPVTGNKSFISEVVKGEYKEWAQFIMRTAQLRDFPLKYVTPLPIENECVFYADRDRWTNREE
ncbi:MAG: hypothetical protein JWQ44_885 [Chthoniobacter sp.]|jgi:hypothetical protein|nr:hypothetical protein [Chthoniobacter sp.]